MHAFINPVTLNSNVSAAVHVLYILNKAPMVQKRRGQSEAAVI